MTLTKGCIKTKLQIAQTILVVQGLDVIGKQRKGKGPCNYKLSQIMQGFDMIDAIVGYDPDFESNCLTEIQIQHVLDRICKLSPVPCSPAPPIGIIGQPTNQNNIIQFLQNQIDAIKNELLGAIEVDR